jgi:hypothetical protein
MSVPAGTRQIIPIDQSLSGGNLLVRVVFWIVPPSNRITLPSSSVASSVPSVNAVPAWGITAAELQLLQSGQLVEQVTQVQMAAAGQTQASVWATLLTAYNAAQAAYSAAVSSIAGIVGSNYNGTAWTAGP